MKGAIGRGHLIIRLLGIEHAEAIVMLGGENQVAKARVLREARPCLRLKAHGMEGAVQREILLPEARGIAFPVHIPARPARVRIRKRPGFANAPLRIAAPVHHEGQLLILEPFQAGKQQRIGWRHVVRRFAVVDDVSRGFSFAMRFPSCVFFSITQFSGVRNQKSYPRHFAIWKKCGIMGSGMAPASGTQIVRPGSAKERGGNTYDSFGFRQALL